MSYKNVIDLRRGRSVSRRAESRTAAPARIHITNASERTSPLRVKRRRTRLVMMAVILTLVAVVAFQLSYVSYMPRYAVSSIASVDGARTISPRLVGRYIDTQLHLGTRPFFSPNNVLSFEHKKLENGIVDFFPRIKSVSVTRASLLATAITVTIEERKEFAWWCADPADKTGCYRMDEDGFIFASADSIVSDTSVQKYVFSGGFATSSASTTPAANHIGASFAPGHMPGILAFFAQLQRIGLTPVGATIDDNGADFTVVLFQGFAIKASFGQDSDALIRNAQLILGANVLQGRQGDIRYIDLRFGDRAYYKLKDSSTTGQGATSTTQ